MRQPSEAYPLPGYLDPDVFLDPRAHPDERAKLEQAISAQASLRGLVDDEVIDAAVAALRDKLAALDQKTSGGQHRKLVSVLFMDIAGSTDIVRDLDPEDSAAIMDGALKRFAPQVALHGGRVTRFMGDGFMALFGDPTARENDPEMAIRAGLSILQQAAKYAVEVETNWGISDFGVRVGINTGLVLIGGYAEAEDTLTGAAVNLAARLEAAAPRQGLLISQGTYQHVSRLFYAEPQKPVAAKGFREPVSVYLITGARPRSFRMGHHGVEGIETRMVGRSGEMHQLQTAYQSALKENSAQIITVIGDAGLGKSRLVDEFEIWLDDQGQDFTRLKGRARLETRNVPYGLFRDLFSHLFDIQDGEPVQGVGQKLQGGFGAILQQDPDIQMKSHLIGRLLGFDLDSSPHIQETQDDPQQIRDRGLKYLLEAVHHSAGLRPMVLFLDDMQWADARSLELIGRLAKGLSDRPVLLLGAARPELFENQPEWEQSWRPYVRIDLAPLSASDCGRLVEDVLRKVEQLPKSLRDLIVQNAEGNPFYAEELIKMLVEDGVLEKNEPHWSVHLENLAEDRVPPTLTGVLQARIDSLPADERDILQRASVAGRVFWTDLIGRLQAGSRMEYGTDIVEQLSRLSARDMIHTQHSSAFAGTEEFIFKHAVLREVAYESVLIRLRRVFHGQIAEWLVDQRGDRQLEYAGLIADHFQLASQPDLARTYLVAAAEGAAAAFANPEAIAYYTRAIALTKAGDLHNLFALYEAREKLFGLLGSRTAQKADLEVMARLADELGFDEKRAIAALRRSTFDEHTGDYQHAVLTAERAMVFSESAHETAIMAAAQNALARALWKKGEIDQARVQALSGAALAHQAGDRTGEGRIQNTLGILAGQVGDFDAAVNYYGEYLEIMRETHDRRGEAAALNNIGAIALAREDFPATRSHLEDCLEIMRQIGDRQREGTILGNLGLVAARLGAFADARAYFKESLHIAREVDDLQSEGLKLNNLGWLAAKTGDFSAAKTYLRQSLSLARKAGAASLEAEALTGLGHAELGLGLLAEAESAYTAALKLHRSVEGDHRAMEPAAGLARLALVRDDSASALTLAEELYLHLSGKHRLEGVEEPRRIYLTCFQVFRAAGDPRAAEVLQAAHDRLQAAVAKLTSPGDTKTFLEATPWRRELTTAWQVHLSTIDQKPS